MDETSQRLDRESEKALEHLVGAEIQTLLSESCDIAAGQSVLEVMSVSIQIGPRKFIVIDSEWADTPKDWLDYHLLSVRSERAPRGIYYNHKPPKNGGNYKFDHLSIRLGAVARVASVDVLEASEQGSTESVVYDAGFLITRADGLKFAIVRADSILGALNIAHLPSDIQELTHDLAVRTRYGA